MDTKNNENSENDKKNNTLFFNIPNIKDFKQISIFEIKDLQGDLKNLSDEAYNKLKDRLLDVGFKYPFFVWFCEKEKQYYYIDGHNRRKTILRMKDEGIVIPEFYPIIEIQAKNKKEASIELLHLNSNYGKITEKGIIGYLKKYEIKPLEIKKVEIKELKLINNVDEKEEIKEKELDIQNTLNLCPECGYEW